MDNADSTLSSPTCDLGVDDTEEPCKLRVGVMGFNKFGLTGPSEGLIELVFGSSAETSLLGIVICDGILFEGTD